MLNDAKKICLNAISRCLPDEGVRKALTDLSIDQEVYLLAVMGTEQEEPVVQRGKAFIY